LAEKYQRFIPSNPALKAEVMNWLFWQVGGQGPITGACFGHFFVYAPGLFISFFSIVQNDKSPLQMTKLKPETMVLPVMEWKFNVSALFLRII
jgi:glutathione S-transferase